MIISVTFRYTASRLCCKVSQSILMTNSHETEQNARQEVMDFITLTCHVWKYTRVRFITSKEAYAKPRALTKAKCICTMSLVVDWVYKC